MAVHRIENHGSKASWARGVVLAGIVLLASGRTARAQFIWYESQDRRVLTENTGSAPVVNTAPDFGPWNSSVSLGTAFASQDSSPGGTSITASAVARGLTPPPPSNPNLTNSAFGTSDLDLGFEIYHPFSFLMTGNGQVSSTGGGPGTSRVRLVDAQGEVEGFDFRLSLGFRTFSYSGVLQPGRYLLDMSVFATGRNGFGGPQEAQSNINFTFTLTPEPASAALVACGLALVRRRR